MRNIQFIIILLLTLISIQVTAQGVQFSQFWNTPLLNNPSFAGSSEGDIRAVINYRSQWGSATTNPFRTSGANFDARFNSVSGDNYFGGGISMYTDIAGASKMRTTLVDLAVAYHVKINNESYFSGGVQAGIDQKSMQNDDLRFDNQFEGTGHNPGLNSNESFNNLAELKSTVSGGISYMWSNAFSNKTNANSPIQGKKSINVGLAVHHFNAPKFYFLNQERLGLKYTGNFEGSFTAPNSPWTIQPAAFVAIQNKAMDIVVGSLFKYAFNENSRTTDLSKNICVGLGGYYRFKDAIIPTLQVEWSAFSLGLSYDLNLSQLSGVSIGRGGFEVSLRYISQSPIFNEKSRARYSY